MDKKEVTKLMEENSWVVDSLARRFAEHYRGAVIDEEDFKQEGYLAGWTYGQGFDPGRGVKFSTYIWLKVQHKMRELVAAQGFVTPVPVDTLRYLPEIRDAETQVMCSADLRNVNPE